MKKKAFGYWEITARVSYVCAHVKILSPMYYTKLLHQELQKRAKFIEKALMLRLMCEIFVDITLVRMYIFLLDIQNIDY